MTTRARSRKAPLPVPLATSDGLADALLAATLTTADHIGSGTYSPARIIGGEGSYSPSRFLNCHVPGRSGRRHFLMIEVSDALFRQLCQHGAATGDDEDNGDDEQDERKLPRGQWVLT